MSWFSSSRHTKVTSFDDKERRLSVDEYVAKVKQSEAKENSIREQKKDLQKELTSLLQKLKDSLKEKGVDVSFKEAVDNIHIPEIEEIYWLPEESFILYKNILFQVTKDDKVL